MAIILQNALERLAAIEVEALASISVNADAKAFMIHSQEAFPYLTHRIGPITVNFDSHDIDVYEVDAVARLVIGHITDGYDGQPENRLYDYLPVLIKAINERELLQSAAYTAALDGLIEARVTSSSGLRIFETAGIQARQVGAELTITLQYSDDIEQQYL